MEETRLSRLKARVGMVSWYELYTIALITFGIPYVAFIFFDWRIAVTVFVISQTLLGVLYNLRKPAN